MTKEVSRWIFPCNPKIYDALGAFAKHGVIDWRTNKNVNEGDIVYIYIGEPIAKILLKTRVVNLNIPDEHLIGGDFYRKVDAMREKANYVRLELIQSFLEKKDYLSFEALKKHGLKGSIQGPLKLDNNPELLEYIKLVEI